MKKNTNFEQELISCRAQLAELQEQLGAERVKTAQLRESRKNLLSIFDGFPEPLFLLDRETRVQMLNRAATIYCQSSFEEAIGKPYSEICPLEGYYCNKCTIMDLVREGTTSSFKREIVATPDRTELLTFFPLSGAKDSTQGTIFRIQDITEQEKMNEQLVLADRLASLSRLSSGVSHEIRNPLASIMLFVDILADPNRYGRTDQELEILGDVKENVQKITDIITRIFDFARRSSSQELPSDINKLMEDMLRLWAPKLKKAGIEVKLALQSDIPFVIGDSVELQQVFSNLILNAIESMPGGGTVAVTTNTAYSAYHAKRRVIYIAVQDTGRGIPSDVQKIIFNPFFSTKTGQAGLGLTISHQIVHRHGGILRCDTSGKQGTTFTLELPIEETKNVEEMELS